MAGKRLTDSEVKGLGPQKLRELIAAGEILPIKGGAFELYRWTFPGVCASGATINAGQPVALAVATAGLQPVDRTFVAVASSNLDVFGVALATAAYQQATPGFSAGLAVVDRGNTIKVTAGASLGCGADVGVATTGQAGNIYGPVAGVAGSVTFRVGKATGPAAAGEVFGLYVDPRQLSGSP